MDLLHPALRSLIRTTLLTTTLVFGTALAGATVGPAGAVSRPETTGTSTSASALVSDDRYEARVQALVNRKRAARGLRLLRFESCTDGTAERWARRLALTGTLVHQDSAKILNTCRARYAAETLGRGGFGARRLVRTWMHSSTHRSVLLSHRATRIGIGSYLNGRGQWVTAANFTRF